MTSPVGTGSAEMYVWALAACTSTRDAIHTNNADIRSLLRDRLVIHPPNEQLNICRFALTVFCNDLIWMGRKIVTLNVAVNKLARNYSDRLCSPDNGSFRMTGGGPSWFEADG